MKLLPSKARLDELLSFDPDTGEIRWKCKSHVNARINIGDEAGTILTDPRNGRKCRQIKIDGILYKAHRLAYYYWTGEQPPEVDHKNGNSLDNRKDNLRAANRKLNMNNMGMHKNNTSGVTGVSYNKRMKLWHAEFGSGQFKRLNKTHKLFKTFEEAVAQRKLWENQYGMTELKKHRRTDVT